jgi:major type 1 subunit fimbrin (pilin)
VRSTNAELTGFCLFGQVLSPEHSMKKHIISAVMAAASLAALCSMSAHAADGTVAISGTVSDTTCSINGAASGTPANVSTVLPTVQAGSLATAGATAGTSDLGDIQFTLTGCPDSLVKAVARFENGPTVDQTTGYLTNQTGGAGAQNVEVRLLNAALQPINITTNANNTLDTNGVALVGGGATLNYYAQYYATAKATSGNINTRVQYTMDYQ